MKTKYHVQITQRALGNQFSERALNTIIKANNWQDRIVNQFSHDEIHFDGSAFDAGFDYIAGQEQILMEHLQKEEYQQSWQAFGRIAHSWQDFFSHSNYVRLWLNIHGNCPPEEITIDDADILTHPKLASGKNYGVIEMIAMLPGISLLVKPLMPPDSHTHMNLDSPSAGLEFNYTYWAALKATSAVYENVMVRIHSELKSENMAKKFKDLLSTK